MIEGIIEGIIIVAVFIGLGAAMCAIWTLFGLVIVTPLILLAMFIKAWDDTHKVSSDAPESPVTHESNEVG